MVSPTFTQTRKGKVTKVTDIGVGVAKLQYAQHLLSLKKNPLNKWRHNGR